MSWAICGILTATDAIPDDPDHWAYLARTDVNNDVIRESDWFRFPYPGTLSLVVVSIVQHLQWAMDSMPVFNVCFCA